LFDSRSILRAAGRCRLVLVVVPRTAFRDRRERGVTSCDAVFVKVR
jgi:hypothetical protein